MKLALAAIALSATATSLVATPTHAGPPVAGPEGVFCTFAAVVTTGPDGPLGTNFAGPAQANVSGSLTCTVQVDSNTHDGPNAAVRQYAAGPNGIIAGGSFVSYVADPGSSTYICTSFRRDDGTVIYWTDGDNARWHTDPTAPCTAATTIDSADVFDILDGEVCPATSNESNVEGPGAQHDYYIDDEGDLFVDANSDGIHESQALSEIVYDCPVYVLGGGDAVDQGVIDW